MIVMAAIYAVASVVLVGGLGVVLSEWRNSKSRKLRETEWHSVIKHHGELDEHLDSVWEMLGGK